MTEVETVSGVAN